MLEFLEMPTNSSKDNAKDNAGDSLLKEIIKYPASDRAIDLANHVRIHYKKYTLDQLFSMLECENKLKYYIFIRYEKTLAILSAIFAPIAFLIIN